MKSLWNDAEAATFGGPLGARVYTSRLLGRDKTLVLHGGGNTSVKIEESNLFGEREDVLYVKGSGWDLETIEPAGFAPVKLDYVRRLASLASLPDSQMVNELATHTLRAGAYSASKAAMNQLARVTALEWGKDGIRINSIHPNAVFDTALWTDELLASRARAYGLTVEQYRKNNLLKTEVSSKDVAELAAEMCGPLFAKTTAAQVPVDGGNDRVI